MNSLPNEILLHIYNYLDEKSMYEIDKINDLNLKKIVKIEMIKKLNKSIRFKKYKNKYSLRSLHSLPLINICFLFDVINKIQYVLKNNDFIIKIVKLNTNKNFFNSHKTNLNMITYMIYDENFDLRCLEKFLKMVLINNKSINIISNNNNSILDCKDYKKNCINIIKYKDIYDVLYLKIN